MDADLSSYLVYILVGGGLCLTLLLIVLMIVLLRSGKKSPAKSTGKATPGKPRPAQSASRAGASRAAAQRPADRSGVGDARLAEAAPVRSPAPSAPVETFQPDQPGSSTPPFDLDSLRGDGLKEDVSPLDLTPFAFGGEEQGETGTSYLDDFLAHQPGGPLLQAAEPAFEEPGALSWKQFEENTAASSAEDAFPWDSSGSKTGLDDFSSGFTWEYTGAEAQPADLGSDDLLPGPTSWDQLPPAASVPAETGATQAEAQDDFLNSLGGSWETPVSLPEQLGPAVEAEVDDFDTFLSGLDTSSWEPAAVEPEPVPQPPSPPPAPVVAAPEPVVPAAEMLARLDVVTLLKQLNTFLLQGRGQLEQDGAGFSLSWSDTSLSPQIGEISVQALDESSVLINGQPFPASIEGVQKGIMTSFKALQ